MTATEETTTATEDKPAPLVEFEPPLACVRRILKNSLPSSTNVGKDAAAAFSRAAGIFIIYVTACANDFAREHKRQTIQAGDVLEAMKELDFDEFIPEMTAFLESYRANEKEKKDAKAKAKKDGDGKREREEDEDDATPEKKAKTEDDEGDKDDEEEAPTAQESATAETPEATEGTD